MGDGTAPEIPWIISVDDHVVEPPDLWSSRLPAKHREVGPHVEIHPMGDEPALQGAAYLEAPGTEGPPVAWWFYEDHRYICFEVDYPHQDSTWPSTEEVARQTFGHLSPAQITKIARGNAIDLLGLEIAGSTR